MEKRQYQTKRKLDELRRKINCHLSDKELLHRYGAGTWVDPATGEPTLSVAAKDDSGRRGTLPHQTAAVFRYGRLVVKNQVVMDSVLSGVLDILREAEASSACC